MLGGMIGDLIGANKNARLKGSMVVMRKNVLDVNDFSATVVDSIGDFVGKGVTCQLISSTVVDPIAGWKVKVDGWIGTGSTMDMALVSLCRLVRYCF